jgi:alpha-L-fucosidase 2
LVSFVGVKHRPENKVAAVVSFFGEHDIVARTGENPCIMDGKVVPVGNGGCLSPGLAAFLGISEVNAQTAPIIKQASPVTYVNRDMPPYLLVHGTRDFNVPFDQSLIMYDAMKKVGADCTVLPVIGAGHGGFDKTPAMREYKPKMVDWIRAHTQEGR